MAEFAAHSPRPGVQSLAVSGEVDIAVVDTLLVEGRACLSAAESVLELDLGAVSFIDSSGLGALVRLRNEAIGAGRSIALTEVPPPIVRLLEVTGLTRALPVRAGD